MNRAGLAATTLLLSLAAPARAAESLAGVLTERPQAVVDLATAQGIALVRGQWRYSDAKVVEIDSKGPGPDLKASGAPTRTHDVRPHAGGDDFDDSSWEVLAPPRLDARRSTGRLCFNWYRTKVTIPEKIGGFRTAGSTVVLGVAVDDYAEVWIDGKLPRALGQVGGSVVGGFNSPNRVVIARDVRPGLTIQIAIFGANGPLSDPPANFIWIKSATLDFFEPKAAKPVGTVERLDPALDAIVPADAVIERVATGFDFIEGPVWVRGGGYLLFSDPNHNVIYRWTPDGELSVFRTHSGYSGADIGEYGQPGSNGLTLDREGRLTIDEHGNRRVTRLEKNGVVTVLADRYEGKRLNSPNDLVYKSDGALYFTDPPFGLPKLFDDPRKELPFSGVFRVVDGKIELVSKDLLGPNGLAFSPDEKFLYVDNWDEKQKVVMRYPLNPDGTLDTGEIFHDMTSVPGEIALDGLKVDQRGNVYVSGPGGIWVLSAQGKHLGTIQAPELPANFAWGDEDGQTLYMTARTSLYRARLNVSGIRP
jgi:gluconolactonase